MLPNYKSQEKPANNLLMYLTLNSITVRTWKTRSEDHIFVTQTHKRIHRVINLMKKMLCFRRKLMLNDGLADGIRPVLNTVDTATQ